MIWRRITHPEVRDDINDAMDYYARIENGLQTDSLDQLAATYAMLEQYPLVGRTLQHRYRHMVLNRFPYMVCYRTTDHQVRIPAVIHVRRSSTWVRHQLAQRTSIEQDR